MKNAMKLKRNNIYISVLLVFAVVCNAGCKDGVIEEITSLNTDRAFSPTELTVTVVNKTGIRVAWKKVNNAESYTIEVFENADLNFSGTPVKKIEGVLIGQSPYTITGFSGATSYSVRVKAVGKGIEDSKWVSAVVKTDTEQIFNPVNLADISAKSVILTWPEGEVATSISLNPGNITHVVTPTEVLAGSATITGLSGETEYTAVLLNGTVTRGTVKFKTNVDIGDAILVSSVDDFKTELGKAVGGEIFALAAGNYDFLTTTFSVEKSISIVAVKAADRPVLKNLSFLMKDGASLKLKNVIVDGGATSGAGVINFAITYADGNYGDLEIDGSIVRNYGAGILGLTSTSVITKISSVVMNNNIFNSFGTGGEFIDFRASFPEKLTFTNNTVYATGAREFIRMDAHASAVYPASKVIITVNNNTLNGIANGGKRVFYVRIPAASHEIIFTKNIVANSNGLLANQAATNLATLSGNNYFAAATMLPPATGSVKVDATGTALDPGFKDPATGDFTISQSDLKSNGIGDPRWK